MTKTATADLGLLARFPPAARARLSELRDAATEAGVTFTPAQENTIVALRLAAAFEAAGVELWEEPE